MSTGRINLHTMGMIGDVDVNYDHSYFTKLIKQKTHFAKEYVNIQPEGNKSVFGGIYEFSIPMNVGDLLKSVCLEIKTSQLSDANHYYIESFGNALIEYAELLIGGTVINRITTDYLQLYTEAFHNESKKVAFKNLINKSEYILDALPNEGVNSERQLQNDQLHCIIDLPFYFHRHPELAIPLCAITTQDISIRIKLRNYDELIYERTSTRMNGEYLFKNFSLPPTITEAPKITKCELIAEFVFLDNIERLKIKCNKTDYVITELQEEQFKTSNDQTNLVNCKLHFSNPVKELYFFIQRDREEHKNIDIFTSPINYEPLSYYNLGELIEDGEDIEVTADQLKYLTLKLDGLSIIDENVGTPQFMRTSQFMRHHSNAPLIYRIYMYSFALDPEVWYPTGQVNFSLIKEQLMTFELFSSRFRAGSYSHRYSNRHIRVYAKSYNILRVENGTARKLF
jgi:hypothetical protein